MKVRWLAGKKQGQCEHVPRNDNTLAGLIAAGICEEVSENGPVADPGIPLHGTQHVVPPVAVTVEWGVRPLPYSQDGKPTVVKHYMSEFTWYAAPPKDCPKEVADRFADALKKWERSKKATADARQQVEDAMARQRNL